MNKRVTTTAASVTLAAGLCLGAVSPAQAAATDWTGPGYSEPSQEELVVPICNGKDFGSFFVRNLKSHFGDARNFATTARSVYGSMFSSPANFARAVRYTGVQSRNFVVYPVKDLNDHYRATVAAYPNGC